ncbi:YciI family protein, partial [Staphylococcus argensis]|uniref:YciI family protein n=1 Tax=Staphylococcus argensis TaxID=1607738 RepID=UPI0036F2B66E
MEITSVNHICFSVSDLNTSIQFYKDILHGDLLVSGPVENEDKSKLEAYLVLKANNEDQLMSLLKADPFWKEGLVADYSIEQ